MTYKNSDQVKEEHITKLGKDFGSVYNALYNECLWVHLKWKTYTGLFGSNEKRIEIMNSTAPRFFWVVQGALLDDTLLHLCRLTDSPKSRGKDNLTIKLLPQYIQNESFRKEIQIHVDKAIESTEFARDWRHRRIAHWDLSLSLDESSEPLKSASRLKVKEAIKAICNVMNEISLHYFDSSTHFELIEQPGGVRELLIHLNLSLLVERRREERIANGEIIPADFDSEAQSID